MMKTGVEWSLIHTQPSMTSAKRSGSCTISGSNGLTWAGASESNSRRRAERDGQRKMKWAESSGSVRHNLQVGSPGRASDETSRRQPPDHHPSMSSM